MKFDDYWKQCKPEKNNLDDRDMKIARAAFHFAKADKDQTYSQLRDGLKGLPKTYYPDLLKTLVEESVAAGVWVPGGAVRFVSKFEPPVPPEVDKKGVIAGLRTSRAEEIYTAIQDQREEILVAFVAKFGFQPEEIEQVETQNEDMTMTWSVRRKEKAGPEPEGIQSPGRKSPDRPSRRWVIKCHPSDEFAHYVDGPPISFGEAKVGIPVEEILPDAGPEDCAHAEMEIDSSPGNGRTEYRGYCRKCKASGYFMQTEEDAARAFRMLSAARILKDIVFRLQIDLQPAGSPPPGGQYLLALWIIRNARERIDRLREVAGLEPLSRLGGIDG